jgi:hypothetical protein
MVQKAGVKGFIAGVALTASISTGFTALADSLQKQINVTYGNIKVDVNGKQVTLKDSDGNPVEPFNYNGSIYLPVRAISEALGLKVSYDDTSSTVGLTGSGGQSGQVGTAPGNGQSGVPSGAPDMSNLIAAAKTTLASLVSNGTITQDQMDKILTYFNKMSTAGTSGQMYDPLAKAVEDGVITQAQADSIKSGMMPNGGGQSSSGSASGQAGAGAPAGQGGPGSASGSATITGTAAYTLSGETATKSNQAITATESNESGIKVSDSGTLTLTDSTVTKTGDTTSEDESNFYGLNAGILAASGSKINLSGISVTTDSKGSNAIFASGDGSTITASDIKIETSADSSRGLDATLTGTVIAKNVDITTAGAHSAALATDRGNGTITVNGGTLHTSGDGSPGIYSTGNITVSNIVSTATGAEAAVIEGRNSITLTNSSLSGAKQHGVMVYQSYSGDAETGTGTFTMNGGSLTAAEGPLFYSTNTDAVINLKDVKLTGASGKLLTASSDRWGTTGSNGATVTFNADDETLEGDITADNISTITASLKNGTTLKGSVNADNTAKSVALALDSSSAWNVTGTSYLTSLTDEDTSLSNIKDNGFTIYYDASSSANSWLYGKTISLQDGGKLTPIAK